MLNRNAIKKLRKKLEIYKRVKYNKTNKQKKDGAKIMLKLEIIGTVEKVTFLINSEACLASFISNVFNKIKNNISINKDS